jgi:S1-C subfamily serine protease
VTRRLLLAVVLLFEAVSVGAGAARPHAWLGVRIRDLSEQEMDDIAVRHGIREGFGVFVVEVMDDTPAARAGVRSGDIVVAIADRPVTDSRVLQRVIGSEPIDQEVPLTVLRPAGRQRLAVRLAAMPKPVLGERIAAEFGFALGDGDRLPTRAENVMSGAPAVSSVARGSAAERGGLEVGDILLEINERPVISREAARDALADLPPETPLKLAVRRGDRRLALTIAAD